MNEFKAFTNELETSRCPAEPEASRSRQRTQAPLPPRPEAAEQGATGQQEGSEIIIFAELKIIILFDVAVILNLFMICVIHLSLMNVLDFYLFICLFFAIVVTII